VTHGRRAFGIGLLLCLLAAPWPALSPSAVAATEQNGWALEPSATASVFDDLAARPCVAHATARPAQRTAPPHSFRALSLAAAPVATPHGAAHPVRATCPLENRRDLHLRNGVLLI
jgi:hypothetical protein